MDILHEIEVKIIMEVLNEKVSISSNISFRTH